MTDLADKPASTDAGPASRESAGVKPRPAGVPYATTTRQAVESLIGSFVWTIHWSMILTCTLELFHSGGDIRRLVGYTLYDHFPIFAISAGVVWVVVLLVLAVTGRLWLTCSLTMAAALTIGMVDRAKLKVRLEPVYPSDIDFLHSPKFLVQMVGLGDLLLGLVLLVFVGVGIHWLGRRPRKAFRPIRRAGTPRLWRSLVVARLAAALVCLLFLGYAGQFNSGDNKVRAAYESAGVNWAFWYQNVNYLRNGVVPGLLYNLLAEPMQKPADYSRATMDEISARWQERADRINATRTSDLTDVNIVSVLSEAFSDPTALEGNSVVGDPLPFTRSLMRRTTSGTMLAQLYGGGTANMEFETLTGQSLSLFEPQVNAPYQQFVHTASDYPTIVGFLEKLGHRGIAVHPYMTAMYQRNSVYKTFGVEEFIHDSTMHSREKLDDNPFISDAAAFDEVVRQVQENEKPLFVNLVTMQNHVPTDDLYTDPWPVKGDAGGIKASLGGYARGINHSDAAMEDFLAKLTESEERTAVIFYGDHLPGIYPQDLYDRNGDVSMKSTPFFIWTNFETEKIPTAALTSPIYFLPLLFKQLGVKIPAYYALLTEMYQSIPAMEQGLRFNWAGDTLVEDAVDEQLLHDYRLVQYDLSVGKRYARSMFY